jgi:Transglycosylase SLT domain
MAVTPITVSPSLASVLNAAGDRNDVDFNYLLRTAIRESSLDPDAKAASSSATGLFQFTDSTWLQVMKSEGPRLGYQQYADAITQDADGDYVIKDPKLRAQVLALRDNPAVAADMAAAFTKSNGDYLKARFGRMPSPGELYIAHFLGPQGAEKMFDAGLQNPDQIAATLFPKAAAANPNIFYDHGQPRTIREVYKALVAGHEGPATLDPGYVVQQMMAKGRAGTTTAATTPGQVAVTYPVPLAPLVPAGGNSRPVTADANDVQDIPSRIGPGDLDFDSMFSTAPEPRIESPLQAPNGSPIQAPNGSPLQAPEEGQGAFFTQLYGQRQ